ncbi:hypothetical protein GGF37_005065, partial [Kickxella alabastrina]
MINTAHRRWARCLVAASVVALCMAGDGQGCGPAVHNEVAERARQWFVSPQGASNNGAVAKYRSILDRQVSSLQAGVAFPDWGYGCMSMDEPAEAAHWTPFLEVGVAYLLRTYSQPYSAQAEQLVAFLFGIASHQVADEQWHSLGGLRDGFMVALANSTFGGEYSRAHDVLDVGGDFAMAHMDGLRYILDKWLVPVDDVLAIYSEMGLQVAQWRMKVCITRQFYAMEAVKRFGMGMFPSYASRAPMLTERIVDYYIGGLSAMAAGTADCWHALVDWFGHGDFSKRCLVSDRRQPQPRPNRTRAFGGKSPAQALLDEMWPREQWMQSVGDSIAAVGDSKPWIVSASSLRFPALPPKPAQNSKVNGTVRGNSHTNRQHAFAPKHQRLLSQDSRPAAFEACAELSTLFPLIKQLYSTSAYSGFGTAVATGDFSGSGHASVAISAPYYANSNGNSSAGAVFVLNKLDISYAFSQQNIDDADPQVLLPPFSASTRFLAFGSALAVIDYNADGIADLAVGSTAYGPDPAGSLLGRVDVYLGHQGAGLSSVPDFTLTATQLSEYTDSPFSQQRIGGFLFGEDVNNDGFVDLLIGAPYHSDVPYETHAGRMSGYISGPRAGQGSGQMGPPDFTLVSPQRQPFEWFGFSARAVHLSETNTTLLLVGAPGHAQADPDTGANHTLAGSIYAFSVNAADPKGSPPEFRGLHFAASKGSTQLGSQMH